MITSNENLSFWGSQNQLDALFSPLPSNLGPRGGPLRCASCTRQDELWQSIKDSEGLPDSSQGSRLCWVCCSNFHFLLKKDVLYIYLKQQNIHPLVSLASSAARPGGAFLGCWSSCTGHARFAKRDCWVLLQVGLYVSKEHGQEERKVIAGLRSSREPQVVFDKIQLLMICLWWLRRWFPAFFFGLTSFCMVSGCAPGGWPRSFSCRLYQTRLRAS